MVCLALELQWPKQQPRAKWTGRYDAQDQTNVQGKLCIPSECIREINRVLDLSLGRLGYHLGAFLGNIDVDERPFIEFLEG
jgi:hypothetical protein